jgi:hypothetical protein
MRLLEQPVKIFGLSVSSGQEMTRASLSLRLQGLQHPSHAANMVLISFSTLVRMGPTSSGDPRCEYVVLGCTEISSWDVPS